MHDRLFLPRRIHCQDVHEAREIYADDLLAFSAKLAISLGSPTEGYANGY